MEPARRKISCWLLEIVEMGATMAAGKFAIFTCVFAMLTGCGTVHNLMDPPNGAVALVPCNTYPFGGVARSSLLAVMGPPVGVCVVVQGNIEIAQGHFEPGLEQVGSGLLLTAAGLGAIVDTPLSLIGDIVTLPLAYGRYKEYWWATWWGKKSINPQPPVEPEPEDASKCVEESIKENDGSPHAAARLQ